MRMNEGLLGEACNLSPRAGARIEKKIAFLSRGWMQRDYHGALACEPESTALHGCGRGRDVAIWLRKKLRFEEAANWLLLTCYRTWTQRRQLDWNCECQDKAGSPAAPTDHHQVWRRWSGCCWVPNVPGAGPRGCPEAEGQH